MPSCLLFKITLLSIFRSRSKSPKPFRPRSSSLDRLLEKAGLSCVDLKNLGIPLDAELYSTQTIIPVDPGRRQHSLVPSQKNNGSFYYHQLDPRINRLLYNERTFPSDSLDSLQKSQDSVVIPTSPRICQEKRLEDISSDPWLFKISSKTGRKRPRQHDLDGTPSLCWDNLNSNLVESLEKSSDEDVLFLNTTV
jgi:hypothetical protein